MSPRCHAPDEHPFVAGVRLHPHPVAEDRPARERAAGVDRQDADRSSPGSELTDEPVHKRALTGARRAGDADQIRPAGVPEQIRDEVLTGGILVLDQRDGAGNGSGLSGEDAVEETRCH